MTSPAVSKSDLLRVRLGRVCVGSTKTAVRSATSKWPDLNLLDVFLLAAFSLVSGSASAQEQGRGPLINMQQPLSSDVASVAGSASAVSRGWRFEPYVNALETFTNNVNLAPSGNAKGDLVSEITPGIRINGKGGRTSLNGFIAAPIVIYARSDSENNQVYPSANLVGNVEAVEKLFYVEAAGSVTQQFFTPFAAQPGSLSSVTQNRYTSTSYRVSPYIKGAALGDITYLLRNNNTWTNQKDTPIETNSSYYNQWLGNVSSPVAPLGWAVDFDRTDVRFKNQDPQLTQLVRARLEYKVIPQLQVTMGAGYEDNRYSVTDYKGAIYGAGLQWSPTSRTSLAGNWEHRFFGSSYLLTANHRTPFTVWNVRVSRNITSYPEQVVALPAGGNVQGLLSDAFSSKIPDPAQRQAAVNQFIQQRGLPSVLSNPVNLYTQQITLQNYQSATFGLLAVRNTIFFTVFNSKTSAIVGSGTPLPLGPNSSTDTTQRGGSITWSHKVTPLINLNATAQTSKTFANDAQADKTTQSDFRLTIISPLTARTSVYGGAGYQVFRSNDTSDYNEATVFAGLNHVFR